MACPVGLGVGRLLAHPVASRGATDRPPRLGGGVYQHGHGVGACRYSQLWHRTPRQPRRSGHTSRLHLVFGRWRASRFTHTASRPVYRHRLGQHSSRLSFERMGRCCSPHPSAATRATHHALNVVRAWVPPCAVNTPIPFLYLSVDCPTAFWFARERTGPVMAHWAFAQKAHLS